MTCPACWAEDVPDDPYDYAYTLAWNQNPLCRRHRGQATPPVRLPETPHGRSYFKAKFADGGLVRRHTADGREFVYDPATPKTWAGWVREYVASGDRADLDKALACRLPEPAEQARVCSGQDWLRTTPGGLEPVRAAWRPVIGHTARIGLVIMSGWLIATVLWAGLDTGNWVLVCLAVLYWWALVKGMRRQRRRRRGMPGRAGCHSSQDRYRLPRGRH
jgi:hypothetical protein